jgi:Tol biopolymer transport system component
LHDIADGRIVIDEILAGTADEAAAVTAPPPESPTGMRRYLPYLVGALGLTAGLWALSTAWLAEPPDPSSGAAVQFEVNAPPDMELSSGLAISPDGKFLVYVAREEGGRTELWLRRLDSVEARPLGGTSDARYPFWSPDSLQVGFFANGQLQVTDLISNSPRALAPTTTAVNVRGAAWGADDTIIYSPNFTGPILRISAAGGEPEAATRIPDDGSIGTHRFPEFLSDGLHFVFFASSGTGTEPGALYLGELGSLEAVELGPSSSRAVHADPDQLLYVRGEALVAHRLSPQTFQLEGAPTSLGISLPGSLAVSGYRSLASSKSGLLIHRQETRGSTTLAIASRAGERIETLVADREAWQYAPRLSPDGKQLLIARFGSDSGRGDLWTHDLERGIAARFTIEAGEESLPAWSPDQQWIAYDSIRSSPQYGIYIAPVGRPSEERLLLETSSGPGVSFWTPEGESIVYELIEADGRQGFWLLDIDGTGEPQPFLPEAAPQSSAHLSPDGDWVAYGSNASGRVEIYVRAFDGTGSAIRISTSGGSQPLWGRNGRELFYLDATNQIVAVAVTPGDPPVFGRPEALFRTRIEETTDRQYDVAPDGQRFIVNESSISLDEPIVVTTDWQRLLSEPRP